MLLAYNNRYSPALTSRKSFSGSVSNKLLLITRIIIFALAGVSIGYWLFLFSNNIVLNYKINSARAAVVRTKQEISSLQESASELVNNGELKTWAENNNFVPVGELGYLNISGNDLAKLTQYNF